LVQQLRPDITDNLHEYNNFYKTVHGADNPTVKKAISYLEKEDGPTALFVHIGNADTHDSYHPLSTVYKNAIGQTDKRISLILEALVKRKNYQNEDWLIVLASDHGGTGWQHGGQSNEERNAYLILNNTYDKTKAKSYCKGFLNPPTKTRPAGWPADMRQIDGATPHILDFFGLANPTEGRKHPACKGY
jgi:predicted AlkP superfamily pyrophosphatase or phosphodiesterase